jgi:hypothetical protein
VSPLILDLGLLLRLLADLVPPLQLEVELGGAAVLNVFAAICRFLCQFFGEAPFKGAEPPVLPFLLISRFTR